MSNKIDKDAILIKQWFEFIEQNGRTPSEKSENYDERVFCAKLKRNSAGNSTFLKELGYDNIGVFFNVLKQKIPKITKKEEEAIKKEEEEIKKLNEYEDLDDTLTETEIRLKNERIKLNSQLEKLNKEELDQHINDIRRVLFLTHNAGELDIIKCIKLRRKYKDLTKNEFYEALGRYIIARNFFAFSYAVGLPIDLNDKIYHGIIRKILSSDKNIILVMLPRGTFKTTVIHEGFAAWSYLHYSLIKPSEHYFREKGRLIQKGDINDFPSHYSAGIAHSKIEKARANLTNVKNHLLGGNGLIGKLFASALQIEKDTQDMLKFDHRFIEKNGFRDRIGNFETISYGKDLIGKHYTQIIVDDWVSGFESNPEIIEQIKQKFWSFFPLSNNSGSFRLIMTGTEYNHNSIYSDLQANPSSVEIIKIPDTYIDDNGQEQTNFPDSLPMKKIDELRKILPKNEYLSQYKLVAVNPDEQGSIVDSLPEYREPHCRIKYNVVIVDPALSKKNKGSQAVVMHVMVTEDHSIFVDDLFVRTGISQSDLVNETFKMVHKHGAKYICVETINYQEALAQIYQEIIIANGFFISVIRHRHYEAKKQHYTSFLQPFFQLNKVFIDPTKCNELILQVKGLSRNDDCVDALSFLNSFKIGVKGMPLFVDNTEDQSEYTKEDIEWQKLYKRSVLKMKDNPVNCVTVDSFYGIG